MTRWLFAASWLLLMGCPSRASLLADLETATEQQHLPAVVACWERAFEASGFAAEYHAVVDFTVEARSGRILHPVVRAVHDVSAGEPSELDDERFESCLNEALARSALSSGGMRPAGDVHVVGFRFAFTGAGQGGRRDDDKPVLVGPRADRCSGLYSHRPPRGAASIYQELRDARGGAERTGDDRDRHARALQRSYDLSLELCARLEIDAQQSGLSSEGRARIEDALVRANETAEEIGAQIGCTVPTIRH
jgi:hypothetical protein